jgi:hypothetical protein
LVRAAAAAEIRWSNDRQELFGNESQECKQESLSIYDVSIDYSIGLYAIYPPLFLCNRKPRKLNIVKTRKNKQVSGTHPRRAAFCVCAMFRNLPLERIAGRWKYV